MNTAEASADLKALFPDSTTCSRLERLCAFCDLVDQAINHFQLLGGEYELRVTDAAGHTGPATPLGVFLRVWKLFWRPTLTFDILCVYQQGRQQYKQQQRDGACSLQ